MKLISFYKDNFSALKGHWKVVFLTSGLEFAFVTILKSFKVFYTELYFLPDNCFEGMESINFFIPLSITIITVLLPLFCRLPLFLSFVGISWRNNHKICSKMGMKMVLLSTLSFVTHILLQFPSDFFTFVIDSISKTENYSNWGGLFFIALFLRLLSFAYYLVAVCAVTFMTFAYLIGSYWVVSEGITVRAVFPRLWKIALTDKKAFLKHGKKIWTAITIPFLTGILLLLLEMLLLIIFVPKNGDFLTNYLLAGHILIPFTIATNYFTWPFTISALFRQKDKKELRFLYVE